MIGEPVMEGKVTIQDVVGQTIVLYDPVDLDSDRFLQISISQPGSMPKGSTVTPEQMYETTKEGNR